MEKIIFLDFDGVLNSTESLVLNNDNRLFYGKQSLESYEARVKTNLSYLDFDKLILLRDFQTGAKIDYQYSVQFQSMKVVVML